MQIQLLNEVHVELLFGVLWWELTEAIAVIVFFANTITSVLPNHSKNKYVQWVYDFLNRLSMNFYRNTNHCDERYKRRA